MPAYDGEGRVERCRALCVLSADRWVLDGGDGGDAALRRQGPMCTINRSGPETEAVSRLRLRHRLQRLGLRRHILVRAARASGVELLLPLVRRLVSRELVGARKGLVAPWVEAFVWPRACVRAELCACDVRRSAVKYSIREGPAHMFRQIG